MILSTSGLVLHTTPYGEASVVAKVFTRQLGLRSYIIKGVRGAGGRVKQNMLQPLSSLDMVVYDSHHKDLNHVKELSPRHPDRQSDPVGNALRFFMTEVLYKTLHEEEPMPDLWDYVEESVGQCVERGEQRDVPIRFMLAVAHHLGIEPLDNYSQREPWFDLQEGRFVATQTETTLADGLSTMLHDYLVAQPSCPAVHFPLRERSSLLDALIAYYQMHLSSFRNFHSHEILHTILR